MLPPGCWWVHCVKVAVAVGCGVRVAVAVGVGSGVLVGTGVSVGVGSGVGVAVRSDRRGRERRCKWLRTLQLGTGSAHSQRRLIRLHRVLWSSRLPPRSCATMRTRTSHNSEHVHIAYSSQVNRPPPCLLNLSRGHYICRCSGRRAQNNRILPTGSHGAISVPFTLSLSKGRSWFDRLTTNELTRIQSENAIALPPSVFPTPSTGTCHGTELL